MKNKFCNNHVYVIAGITFAVNIGSTNIAFANQITNFNQIEQSNSETKNQQSTIINDTVELIADTITQSKDETKIEAIGNVQARNKSRRISADKLIYDRSTGVVTAVGNVVVVNPDGSNSFASELIIDDEMTNGVINDFASRYPNGGIVASKKAIKLDGNKNTLTNVVYTACPVCEKNKNPTWQVKAKQATQDEVNKSISYKDVVFSVEGIPLAYFPYFRHGDPTAGRQSGFLQPIPGRSSRLGANWEQPYLFVIDKYSDLTISPMVAEYVNPLLNAKYRRKFYSGLLSLEGSITKEQKFGLVRRKDDKANYLYGESDWRGSIFGSGDFKINENSRWGFGVENASDDLYLMRYSIAGQGIVRGPIRGAGTRLINQLYVETKHSDFYARILGASFQDLIPGERRKNTPQVSPNLEIIKNWEIGPINGRLDTNLNAVYLNRNSDRQDTTRVSGGLRWSGQTIIASGIVFEPSFYSSLNYYNYSNQRNANNINIGSNNFTQFRTSAGFDLRYPLAKYTNNLRLSIEPKASFKYSKISSENRYISNEDSVGIENTANTYFLAVRNSVYDAWDNGNKATLGVNFGAANPNNFGVNLFVGKEYRSKINNFERSTNLDRKNGDWVSSFDININDNLSLQSNINIDAEDLKLVRTEVIARLSLWRIDTNVRYNEMPKAVGNINSYQEIIASATLKINDKVKVFSNNWFDFKSNTNLRSRYGVMFGDDCTDVRVFYEEINTTNQLLKPSSGIKIQIAFKTLGAIDDDPFE